jgi:hypothetical protein
MAGPSLGSFCQNNCEFHEIFTGCAPSWMENIMMMLSLAGVLTISLLIGFALGYVVRPHVSAA